MSYKRVNQLGYVVKDMAAAQAEYGRQYHIRHWFRATDDPPGEIFYRGKKICSDGFSLYIGYCGKTEIELITSPKDENMYSVCLAERGAGFNHISFFVPDLDKCVAEYRSLGYEVIQSGKMNGKTAVTRYAYMAKPEEGYSNIVEFGETKIGKITMTRIGWKLWIGNLTGDSVLVGKGRLK